jgi:NAD(P)-dependent dehydrogenase (short-subunit alcohol dehydrogenase family)
MQLANTTAIVTGSASGLGAATAAALADNGVHVFGLDLPGALESAPEDTRITYVAADVTNADQVRAAVNAAASWGSPHRTGGKGAYCVT